MCSIARACARIQVYTTPEAMWGLRVAFDAIDPDTQPHIFASEYAVTTGGGRGNLWVRLQAVAALGSLTPWCSLKTQEHGFQDTGTAWRDSSVSAQGLWGFFFGGGGEHNEG
jgi:hypothetical protein